MKTVLRTSRKRAAWLTLAMALALSPVSAATDKEFDWAYPVGHPFDEKPDTTVMRHVPGSDRAYTQAQIDDFFNVVDWFPGEHPPMPDIVAHGYQPTVLACARCHLPNGMGHPESAMLAGQPAAYLERQFDEFAGGHRTGSYLADVMTRFAHGIKPEDAKAAAEYFAALKPIPWSQVVETETVPKTRISLTATRLADPGGKQEPLGDRIIVLPQDEQRAENRDPHSGFVSYVPPGSIERGKILVTAGGGKTVACAGCHGATLRGQGEGLAQAPAIAGLSPIFIVRQLNDIQRGARAGAAATLMKPVVQDLDTADMIAIGAYIGTLTP